MKKKIKLFLSSVVFICGIFTSCENLLSVREEKQTEQSYIRISTNLSSVDRSVLPSDSFKENTTGLTWTLSGSRNGTAEITIKVWNDEGDTAAITQTAYQKMINDSFIPVDEGTWIFTLTAKNNSGKVLEATKEKTITGGQNILVFDMKEAVGEGAASGQIEFTLKWKELNVVGNVAITLSKRNDSSFNNIEVNYEKSTSIDKDYEYVNFFAGTDNSPLEAGSYMLKMELRQQTGFSDSTEATYGAPIYTPINTYTCLIHVAPGLCSKGDAELETLAPLYKVIFDGIEGIEFEESIVSLSYNAYTTFALPRIKEEDGYEYQWHKTGDDPDTGLNIDKFIEDPLKVCINENAHTFVLYRYKIVAEDDIVRTAKGDSTGDYFSIGTAEGLGIFRDLVNGCNENLKMVDNSEGSEKVFVYYETGSSKSQLNATLTSDIDLTQLDGNELSWVPINGYSGTFDGAGKEIKLNKSYKTLGTGTVSGYCGLFSMVDGATIKDLTLTGEETIICNENDYNYFGGFAGFAGDSSSSTKETKFINCVNKRKLTVSGNVGRIGGFVGYFKKNDYNSLTFENCINLGEIYVSDVSTEPYVAGFTTGATSYRNCINAGNVTGASYLYNGADVASGTVAGFDASVFASFTNCINLGDISANSYKTDDGIAYSTEKVYGFSSIESDNFPSFENCIDAGSAKQPFTGVVDNTTGTYKTCYYNSDSYGSDYNTDYAKTSDELCQLTDNDLPGWDFVTSRYPLPKIEKNFSENIWQEVVAKATLPKGTRGNPFVTWEELAKYVYTSSDSETTVYIAGTLEATGMTYVYRPVTIMATGNATIKRVGNCTNFFQVSENKSLKITGTEENNIILDGGDTSTIPLVVDYPLIQVSQTDGSVTLEYCTIQNANCGTDSYGAGLYATSYTSVTIKNCTFTNNTGYDISIEQCNNLTLSGNVEIPKLYFKNELTSSKLTINVDEDLTGSVNIVLDEDEGALTYDLDLFNLDDGTSLPEGVFTLDNPCYAINSDGTIAGITTYSDWTTLADAITNSSNTTSEFVLKGDIIATSPITVSNKITLKALDGADGVTITRGAGFILAFFDNTSTLTLEGITLDGGKNSNINAESPLITSSGNLTLNNCTLQNNKNTSTTPGGAINISAGTFTMNGGVIGKVISEDVESKKSWEYAAKADNYSNYAEAGGGGIYVASGDVTIDNATISYNYTPNPATNFENKTPSDTAHGGGISIVSGSLSLKGSEVSYNSGYQGGGIRCYQNSENSSGNILTLEKSKIIGNISNPYYCNGFGGGVMVKNFTVKFEGDTPSVIEENYSGDGGALFLENTNSILQNTTSTLQNITIQNNSYNENGYKNGSEVLLYSGANISIGSSNVTIQSAAGETRGIFMNNNNTLNLSGDAKIDTPIYLTNRAKVTVSEELTSEGSIVATITPQYYPGDTMYDDQGNETGIAVDVSVLTVGTGVTLNDIVERFAVTPKINAESNTEKPYTIDSSGMLYLVE